MSIATTVAIFLSQRSPNLLSLDPVIQGHAFHEISRRLIEVKYNHVSMSTIHMPRVEIYRKRKLHPDWMFHYSRILHYFAMIWHCRRTVVECQVGNVESRWVGSEMLSTCLFCRRYADKYLSSTKRLYRCWSEIEMLLRLKSPEEFRGGQPNQSRILSMYFYID